MYVFVNNRQLKYISIIYCRVAGCIRKKLLITHLYKKQSYEYVRPYAVNVTASSCMVY